MPSDIPSTSSDSSTGSSTSVNVYHIYSPDANLSKLPAKERKKIQQLYKKEMEWASHHKKPSPGFSKDSLSRAGSAALPQEKLNRSLNDFQYYVSGKLGLMKYLPRITDNSNLSWEQELNYKYEIKNSFYPAIGFGFIVNHFMIGTGIAYHQLSIKGEGRAIYPKGKSGKADTATVSFSDSYSVVPIPLEVSFFQQRKSFFIGAGLKFELDFIHFKGVKSNRFESYYLLKEKDGVYYEKYNKLAAVGSLNILAGVVFQKKMILASGVEYNYCISPFSENTLYNFYPSSLLFKVSFFYFLSKYDFKRNVMK